MINGVTANGVKIVFQHNHITLREGDSNRPLLRFDDKENLTEINLDGYSIVPIELKKK